MCMYIYIHTHTHTHNIKFTILTIFSKYLFLERGEEREKEERNTDVKNINPSHPDQGPNLQPRHVPWPGIELPTFCIAGWRLTNWGILVLAFFFFLNLSFEHVVLRFNCTIYIFWMLLFPLIFKLNCYMWIIKSTFLYILMFCNFCYLFSYLVHIPISVYYFMRLFNGTSVSYDLRMLNFG